MRTTVTLDDELAARAAELSGITGYSALISEALETLVRIESARRLSALGGTDPDGSATGTRRSR